MHPARSHPALRLVGADVAQPQRVLPRGHTHRQPANGRAVAGLHVAGSAAPSLRQLEQVAAENKAATLGALDPRWALAVRTSSMLVGGRAAILPPESRRFLVSLGKDINLRPFDSNLIIAIVQDAARSGADPIGEGTKSRLAMVRQPVPVNDRASLRWAIGAIGLGGMLAWFLIRAFGA